MIPGQELYALLRLLLWVLLALLFSIDWAMHFRTPILKRPLFLVLGAALLIQLTGEAYTYWVISKYYDDVPWKQQVGLIVLGDLGEVSELTVIALISTGWGVIYTSLAMTHRISLGAGLLSFLVFLLLLTLTRGSMISAIWGIAWLLTALWVWFYVISMMNQNIRFLSTTLEREAARNRREANPLPAEAEGGQQATPRTPPPAAIGQVDSNSPAYLKRQLYQRFVYLVVTYIFVLFGTQVITSVALLVSRGRHLELLWLARLPGDLLELGLFYALCYLFRLREDNPYFALPTSEEDAANFSLDEFTVQTGGAEEPTLHGDLSDAEHIDNLPSEDLAAQIAQERARP